MALIRTSARVVTVLALLVAATGCRGAKSPEPPVHLNPNMDLQDKYKPYRASTFFKDGRSMRTPPQGTVARGKLRADDALWKGKDVAGNLVDRVPFALTAADVRRGQQRYGIYCAPCHGMAGYGNGTVTKRSRGKINAPSFHTPRLGKIELGHIYDVITNGSASKLMWGYRHQIPEAKERWRIAAYVRALQRSQSAERGHVFRFAPDQLKAVDQAYTQTLKK